MLDPYGVYGVWPPAWSQGAPFLLEFMDIRQSNGGSLGYFVLLEISVIFTLLYVIYMLR